MTMIEDTSLGMNKIVAISFVLVLLLAAFSVIDVNASEGSSEERASIGDLMGQESVRYEQPGAVVASGESPFYALIGTPLALYYDDQGELHEVPLLVADSDDPSSAVDRFLMMYDHSDILVLGEAGDLVSSGRREINGDPEMVSLEVASTHWVASDGAMIVEPSQLGYNMATMLMPLASYLDIPVIIANRVDGSVRSTLRSLGVGFTIVCGNVGGYGKVMRFPTSGYDSDIYTEPESAEMAFETTRTVLEDRLQIEVDYLTLANPLDAHENRIIDSVEYHFEDIVGDSSSGNYPGAAPNAPDGPIFRFEIPEGWTFANLKVDIKMDVSQADGLSIYTLPEIIADLRTEGNSHDSGERIYAYIGLDGNDDGAINADHAEDALYFFGGSPGTEYITAQPDDPASKPLWAHFYTELAQVNSEGPMDIQVLARLPTDDDGQADFTIDITIDRIDTVKGRYAGKKAAIPVYSLMKDASSMAGYITAHHGGLILSKPQFVLHSPGYIGCQGCGVPAANEDTLDEANRSAIHVKKDVIWALGRLKGMDIDPAIYDFVNYRNMPDETPAEIDMIVNLASEYQEMFYSEGKEFNLAIVGDTNMIPQYYYASGQGDPTEGFGMPSDNFYMSIDADPYDAPYDLIIPNDTPYDNVNAYDPDFEIGVGRIDGWDAQDISALIARTAFYHDIIDNHQGDANDGVQLDNEWKRSAYTTLGTIPPVEVAALDLQKFERMAQAAGFYTGVEGDEDYNQMSRRQYTEDSYESANFLFFCSHGFYYWYVPTAQEGADGIPDPISKATYGGGAYDVAHVRYMDFGPTVIFGSSCVTGRIDGLYPVNALSLAFLHAGMNAYIGATRMSWGTVVPIPDTNSDTTLGDYLALCMYANLLGYIYDKTNDDGVIDNNFEDLTMGFALMDAKNKYIRDVGTDNGGPDSDTINEFMLHGDPAFNPYEPNHEG